MEIKYDIRTTSLLRPITSLTGQDGCSQYADHNIVYSSASYETRVERKDVRYASQLIWLSNNMCALNLTSLAHTLQYYTCIYM